MFGLSFLYPAFLIGATAAVVPILLHLLKRETAPAMPFSAVRFLKRAPEERSWRKRLRELLLLALRVSALVLLAAAFARPYLAGGAGRPSGVTIVAVDTSFSLSSPGRFDRARALAREAVGAAETGHLVGVVAFSDNAAVVAEPSADRIAARSVIDRLEPGFGATRYRVALDRAFLAIGGRGGAVVVVTDMQRTGWRADSADAVPDDVAVSVLDVGDVPSNLAITSLAREGSRIVAVVRNGGAGARAGRVRLSIDDRAAGEAPFALEPGESDDVEFSGDVPERGVVLVSIDDPTGYAADDARYLVLDRPPPATVLLVTPTGGVADNALYVARALEGAGSRFRVLSSSGRMFAEPGDRLAEAAVVALLSTHGLDRRAGEAIKGHVERGGGLLMAGGDGVEPWVLADLLGDLAPPSATVRVPSAPVTLALVDVRHPIARPFAALGANLGLAQFRRTLEFEAGGWEVVARFSDGTAALVERRAGRGRVMLFASDLDNAWNDLPLQPLFVPFLHETMAYVAGVRPEAQALVVGDAPAGAPLRPGVATIGTPPRRVAINADPRESDPERLTESEFLESLRRVDSRGEADAALAARQAEAEHGYWRYGLALVLMTLMVEGLVGRKA